MTGPTVERFLGHLRDGIFRDTAEALCGLGRGTVDNWMARGRKDQARRDARLQSDGELGKPSKWAAFVTAVENAEACAEAECWGTLTEVRRTRGPSPGNDENGNPIPGPILHPEVASKNAQWQLTRKDNLRFGAGSQRTDLVRSGDGADGDADAGKLVLDLLDRRIERRLATRPGPDGE